MNSDSAVLDRPATAGDPGTGDALDRERIERLLDVYEFAEAERLLLQAIESTPRFSRAEGLWVRAALREAHRGPVRARREAKSLMRTARRLIKKCSYESVAPLLADFPESYRTPEMDALAKRASEAHAEVERLETELEERVRKREGDAVVAACRQLLTLQPAHSRAKKLLDKYTRIEEGVPLPKRAVTIGEDDEYVAEEPAEPDTVFNGMPLIVGGMALVLVPLTWFLLQMLLASPRIAARFEVASALRDQNVTVHVDGREVDVDEEGGLQLPPGEHEIEVRNEAGEAVGTTIVEIVDDTRPVIEIRAGEDGIDVALSDETKPTPELLVREFEGLSSAKSVDVSPDGMLVAAAGADNEVYVWDLATGEVVARWNTSGEQKWVVRFSPNGALLAVSSGGYWRPGRGRERVGQGRDFTVRVWAVESGKLKHTFKGHTDAVTSLAFGSDGSTVFSGDAGEAGTVRKWDLGTGEEAWSIEMPAAAVDVTPDGETVFVAVAGHAAKALNADSGEVKFETAVEFVPEDVRVAPDGESVFVGAEEPKTKRLIAFPVEKPLHEFEALWHRGGAFSRDGDFLAGPDRVRSAAFVFSTETGELAAAFAGGDRRRIEAVGFTPDARHLLTAGASVRMWRMPSEESAE